MDERMGAIENCLGKSASGCFRWMVEIPENVFFPVCAVGRYGDASNLCIQITQPTACGLDFGESCM